MPNLIGTAPDQVPVNGFLGNMAFQNKEGVVVDLLSTTTLSVSGNVGIGTTTPKVRLQVTSATTADPPTLGVASGTAYFTNNNDAYGLLTGLRGNGDAWLQAQRTDATATAYNILLNPSGGNVGIGTSSTAYKLDVNGTSYFSDNMLISRTNTAGSLSGLTITNAGTTSAYAGINIGSGTVSTQLFNDAAGNAVVAGAVLRTTTNHPLVIGTNSTERMRITAAGDVGIGTSSPTGRLQVSGTGYILNNANADPAGGVTIPNVAGTFLTYNRSAGLVDSEIIYGNTVNSFLRFTSQSAAGVLTERMRVNSAGDVGIGIATPDARLHLHSTAGGGDLPRMRFTNGGTGTAATDGMFVGISNTSQFDVWNFENDAVRVGTNNAERMRVTGAGLVGIGTNAPLTRLHVSQSNTGDYASVVLLSNSADTAADRTGIYGSPASGTANPYRGGITFHPGATGAVSIHTGNNATPSAGERVRIDGTNGFVGIATTAPDNLLTLGTSAANQGLALKQSTITVARFALVNPGVDNTPYIGSISNNAFAFWANGSERMRITSAGDVCVGTTTAIYPTANRGNITVGGSVSSLLFLGNSGVTGTYLNHNQATNGAELWNGANGPMQFATNNTEKMRITAAGDVGIGTTSPGQKLSVAGSAIVTLGNSYFCYTNDYGIGTPDSNGLQVFASNGDVLRFGHRTLGTTFTEDMRIASNGNVGIKTTNPTAPLTVSAASVMSRFQTGTASDGRIEFAYNTTDIGYLNMGSASLLDLTARSGVALAFGAGGSERMRIDSSGNVGIGTSSPSFKLDVQGNSSSTATVVRSRNNDTSASSLAAFNCSTGQGVNAEWYSYSGANWFGTKSNHPQLFITNNTERARISAAGGFSVGTTTDAGVGNILASGNVTAYSDIRVKDNVEQITGALGRVQRIRGVTYTRTDLEDTERRYAGVIAQEIEEVLPEAIFDSGELKAVDYNATIGLLIEAIKELTARVAQLEGK